MALTFNLETIAAEDTLTLSPSYPDVADDTFSTSVDATGDLSGTVAQTTAIKGSFHFKLDAVDALDGNVASPMLHTHTPQVIGLNSQLALQQLALIQYRMLVMTALQILLLLLQLIW